MVHAFLARDPFPRDLFSQFDRLQREFGTLLDGHSSIHGDAVGGYPALNVGSTPTSLEVCTFAPGLDPARIDVQIEKGVLTIDGERTPEPLAAPSPADGANHGTAAAAGRPTRHLQERFTGRFRRVVSLPDDVDPQAVQARYRDGVLQVSIRRREATLPRRIDVV